MEFTVRNYPKTVSALKLPILKTGDYDLWKHENGAKYLTQFLYSLGAPIEVSWNQGCKDLMGSYQDQVWRQQKSKKMQKTIMKQQYENFTASRSEGLDKTYEDANLKLLRSLPSAWKNIALIMRNKFVLDTMSMDDLYNNLKVYKVEIKGQSSSSSNSQNVAFVSSKNTSNTNEAVNTTHEVSTASS
ncbi:hypothetical protein Tco_0441743 [Tanacetum coccineum]